MKTNLNNSKKGSVFICSTFYHILISTIKALKAKEKPDLLLIAFYNNKSILEKNILNKLRKSEIFKEIIILDYSEEAKKIYKSRNAYIKKLLFILKKNKEFNLNLEKYMNIYLYNDDWLIGRIINMRKIKYHLLEDGTNNLRDNIDFIEYKVQGRMTLFIKRNILHFYKPGKSKNIIDIEVNDINGVDISDKKIIQNNKEKMFKELSLEEKKKITDIFCVDIELNKFSGYTLILTQPFDEDGVLNITEKEKINIYKTIIDLYCKNEKVVIKPHPREETNYNKYIKCDVIKKEFPIEILNFDERLKFKKVITISSTAIELVNYADEKIKLGWEWLEEYKKSKV